MGGALLSAVFPEILAKLNFPRKWKHSDWLENALLTFAAVVDDAEEMQFGERGSDVRRWLDKLQDVLYLLEEVVMASHPIHIVKKSKWRIGLGNKICRFLPTMDPHAKIGTALREIFMEVDELLRHKDKLGLTESVTQKETTEESLQKLASYCSVLDDHVYGRDEEIREILEFLLPDKAVAGTVGNTSVIGILGNGGIGKTTLAWSVYNDSRVKLSFGFRAWVTVSQIFSAGRLAEKILEAFKALKFSQNDNLNLDLLTTDLKEYLRGEKFLLVLDDCWDLDKTNWNLLQTSFEAAARGSVIIVTTSQQKVVEVVQAAHVLHLQGLSLENCKSLLTAYAFGHGNLNLPSDPKLDAVGTDIMKRCQGLPLAVKMLGGLLHAKRDLDEWNMISMSKLWEGDSNLWPPWLSLCYLDLPSNLKRCFMFLSLFPKGYEFRKEEVVLLWMAEGFLKQSNSNDVSMEDVGVEYFELLLARSFIQKSHNDPGACFQMHDLLHDLASFLAGEFYLHLETTDELPLISRLRRHLSFSRSIKDVPDKIWKLDESRYLRTFLALYLSFGPRYHLSNKAVRNLVSNSQFLQVLSLSGCDIVVLPSSIGKLRHLQYLNLSFTRIRTLPESICDLYNLQTLKLSFCDDLTNLPAEMAGLINLRHLDIKCSGIQGVSLLIGRLTGLRALTDFVVGNHDVGMEELAGLSNLRTLAISNLHNVVSARDASSANLTAKKHLDDLCLQWSFSRIYDQQIHREVLENLEPPKELKRLTIDTYCGNRFPEWLGNASFSNLVFLHLLDCSCLSLPRLGQLPLLKDLLIEGFDKVSYVGPEFYGMAASRGSFKSLQTLKFNGMLEWKEWVPLEVEGSEFPCLYKLCVQNCPKLVRDLPQHLPSLKTLEISGCHDLVAVLPKMPNDCEVLVSNCNDNLMRNVPKVAPQTSLHGAATLEDKSRATPKFSSDITCTPNSPSDFVISVSEIEEVADEPDDQIKAAHPRVGEIEELADEPDDQIKIADFRYPFPSGSSKASDISRFGELSSRMDNARAEEAEEYVSADIPYILQDVDSRISCDEAGVPSNIVKAAQPATEALNMIDHSEDQSESFSSPDTYDHSSSFEILKISDLSLLKRFPRELHSLRMEGCEFLESLPDALIHLISTLRDLYIIDCCSLKSFSSRGYPTSLRILYIRNCRKLELRSALQTTQKYEVLEQLCIGSSCDSLTSLILNWFPKLKILCIWDCPSLVSLSISEGFQERLLALESLEIRDCPNLISFPVSGLPTPNLASIWFSNCKNLNKLPNFMNSLTCLQSLILHKCPELESFPVGGLPSNLNVLSIALCDKLTPSKEWGLYKLDSLSSFEIEGGCISLEAFPETELLPSSLNSLRICSLSSLKMLDYNGLQHLNALEALEISCCSKLSSLPKDGLPSSLVFLCIKECPLLTPKLLNKAGRHWSKIACVPNIQIDDSVNS